MPSITHEFLRRWIGRTGHLPPRDFWPTLFDFLRYAFVQARHAAKRRRGNSAVDSHLNFKRAHYLEKAMLCDYGRSGELDASYAAMTRYLKSPLGLEDDCYLYLQKMAKEYEDYPEGFRCYMHDAPVKPPPEAEARILRRLIVQRRSVRRFAPEPVSEDKLKNMVEAGSYAPTSCNAQPLLFLTITDRQTLDLLFGAAGGAMAWSKEIPTGIVIATDRRHYKPFQQHAVMFQDIAAAAQNCLLMAEALGLAACWVSLIADSHIKNQKAVYQRLNLPDHLLIGAAIAIGEPINTVCHVPHRPLHKVWHKERFDLSQGTGTGTNKRWS